MILCIFLTFVFSIYFRQHSPREITKTHGPQPRSKRPLSLLHLPRFSPALQIKMKAIVETSSSQSNQPPPMLFVQVPPKVPLGVRAVPPRCSPSMIRAPPSRPLPATVPSRVTVPSTHKSSSHTSQKQAPQVKAAAVAVRAAAVAAAAAAAAAPSKLASPTKTADSDNYSSSTAPSNPMYPLTPNELQERYLSRTSGRNQKYVRDSIENDRPAAINIAQMVAPEMMRNRREHYFENPSPNNSTSSSSAVSAPRKSRNGSSRSLAGTATTTTENPARKNRVSNSSGTATSARVATQTQTRLRGRGRGRPKRSDSSRFNVQTEVEEQMEDRVTITEAERRASSDDDDEDKEDIVEVAPTAPLKEPRGSGVDDSIRTYLTEIGEVKLLDADTEVELARNIARLLQLERLSAKIKRRSGADPTMKEWAEASGLSMQSFRKSLRLGLRAKEHMVAANLRLVVSIAKKYTNRGLTFQDLIQEGSIGLIRGAEKFDANKGFKFSTYATWWIRQAITRAIADHSRPIRLPVHVNDTISSISKATKLLQNDLGRPATENELASYLKITVDKLQFIMRSSRSTISLETPMSKDGLKDGANLGSMIVCNGDTPDQMAEKTLLREDLENLLNTLTPRERDVVRMRYGFDDGRSKTLEEIGTTFAVTRERIRQIESKALRKLRHPNRNAGLREYVYGDM